MIVEALAWAADHAPALLAVTGASVALELAVFALYWRQRRRGVVLTNSLEVAATQLETLGTHDGLTGLFSQAGLEAALDDAVQRSDRGGGNFCLLYVDVDNLRTVNDAYGHAAGDAVLKETAKRLAACQDDKSLAVSRIVADEFALLVPGGRDGGLRAAVRIAAAFERPFAAGARELRLSCSIGIAAYPAHGARPQLVGNAVLAMRSVKLAGGGAFAEYDPYMGVAVREQADLLQDLRGALERGQFELFYQPKVDARSLQITAAEALLRWRHPQRGIVGPALFIPLAEQYGLIGPIGDWVIREACRQAAHWRESGMRMRVAVNLSGYQMRQDDLVDRIEAALRKHRIPPSRFTCEITESVAMEDTAATQQAFERLRRVGVHVSIDDFGTGHSSLALLRRLPAAELKIDRAFVGDLDSNASARSIAGAIVQMAHSLDLRVVAEGVETAAQRDVLVGLGCDELQGYLFARPMSAQALGLWARDDRPGSGTGFRASLFDETRPAELDDRA
jgi:diguanylate cyclase